MQVLLFFAYGCLLIVPRRLDPSFPEYFQLPVLAMAALVMLNDGVVIAVAYDEAAPSLVPERWDLQSVFLVSSALGLVPLLSSAWMLEWGLQAAVGRGPLASFFVRQRFYPQLQTALYLKLSLDCFLTVLAARTEGAFTSRPPGRLLLATLAMAVSLSSFIAVAFPMGGTDPINMGALRSPAALRRARLRAAAAPACVSSR